MKLLLYSGGKDSQRIYDNWVDLGLEFIALQFISNNIEPIDREYVEHVYITNANDLETNPSKLLIQDMSYLFTALGFAKGCEIDEIAIGIIKEDFDKEYLAEWLGEFLTLAKNLANENGIKITMPLMDE